jgi:hypothetical protein
MTAKEVYEIFMTILGISGLAALGYILLLVVGIFT